MKLSERIYIFERGATMLEFQFGDWSIGVLRLKLLHSPFQWRMLKRLVQIWKVEND